MEEISAKTQMAKIRNFEKGFMATHLMYMGAVLGIFETINEHKEGISVSDLASKLNLHEPYLKVWCQTAYHFGLLDVDDLNRFRLQPYLDEILGDKNHYKNYLGNITLDVALVSVLFNTSVECFRTGEKIQGYQTSEFSRMAYDATKNVPLAFLFVVLPKAEHLRQKLEQGIRFLDIGCGAGNLIIQLAKAFEKSTFVGIDPAVHGIESARANISNHGLGERVAVGRVGAESIHYKDEFDIVSMVLTLHEIPPAVREETVKKAYQALKKDGYFVVLDFPYPSKLEDFRNPLYDYGIVDQFYEIFGGVVHLNSDQQDEIITNAGFKNIQHTPIGKGMFDLITATK